MKYKPHELFGLFRIQESFSVWTGSRRLVTDARSSPGERSLPDGDEVTPPPIASTLSPEPEACSLAHEDSSSHPGSAFCSSSSFFFFCLVFNFFLFGILEREG